MNVLAGAVAFCLVSLNSVIDIVISDVPPHQKYVRIKEDFNSVVLQRYTLHSVSKCASFCQRHGQAIRYFTGNRTCVLHTLVRNIQTNIGGQMAVGVISYKGAGCSDDWIKVLESCYLPRFSDSDWDTASQFCTSHSGHLAVITSKYEQDDLVREFNASVSEAFWIGGKYAEFSLQWSWINGEPWSYTRFGIQQNPGQNCLSVYKQNVGTKRQWDCSLQKFALCEKPLNFLI